MSRIILLLAAAAALAGCNREQQQAVRSGDNDTDPALTSALEDQILVDPALTQQSNSNAVRPPETPAQVQYPAESAGRSGAAERARQDLWNGGGAGCGEGPFNYDPAWAQRLPPTFPLPPGAKLTEAAGHDERGCSIRVVTYSLGQGADQVLNFYRGRALDAGYSAEQQRRDGDHVLAGSGRDGSHYYLIVTPKPNGSDVALIANKGA